MIQQKIDRLIVMEDDFCINDSKICDKILNLNTNKFDLVYLGRKKFSHSEEKCEENNDLVIPDFSYWTIGYIITLNGANKLVNNYFFNNMIPIDVYLGYMTSDKC